MGIRFFCPNGHSLNVRAELAGEIGFCPKCQVRMLIPTESMRLSGEKFVPGVSRTAEARPKIDSENVVSSAPAAENTGGVQENPNVVVSKNELGVSTQTEPPLGDIIRQVASASASGREEKREEETRLSSETSEGDANALWMVNVRGQEYGPATLEVVQSWISQRRVAPKTLVWRQGWNAWKEAQDVFPEIKEAFERPTPLSDELSIEDKRYREQATETNEERQERLIRRKKKASTSTFLICGLIALSLALLIALIVILLKQN